MIPPASWFGVRSLTAGWKQLRTKPIGWKSAFGFNHIDVFIPKAMPFHLQDPADAFGFSAQTNQITNLKLRNLLKFSRTL